MPRLGGGQAHGHMVEEVAELTRATGHCRNAEVWGILGLAQEVSGDLDPNQSVQSGT
jgi:hypothetical protein